MQNHGLRLEIVADSCRELPTGVAEKSLRRNERLQLAATVVTKPWSKPLSRHSNKLLEYLGDQEEDNKEPEQLSEDQIFGVGHGYTPFCVKR